MGYATGQLKEAKFLGGSFNRLSAFMGYATTTDNHRLTVSLPRFNRLSAFMGYATKQLLFKEEIVCVSIAFRRLWVTQR